MNEQSDKYLEDFIADYSFGQFVSGESKESAEKWEKWIKENPSAKEEFEKAVKVMKFLLKTKRNIHNLNTEEELDALISKIRQENSSESSNRFISRFQWFRIAAIFLMLVTVAGLLYFISESRSLKENQVMYNEIIVPLGEKSQVILSDGTHIWINSSSKLKYPVNFNNKIRTVFLEGEAFFDVTRKEEIPFEVFAPNMKIKVLGTAFNVKNYPGDKKAVTTVVRGLVRVESKEAKPVFIRPNENYTLFTGIPVNDIAHKDSGQREKQLDVSAPLKPILNKKVNVEAITSWKDQMLVFSDETLEDVAQKMERWYNVKIYIQGEDLKKERYRGKFVNNETIYQVLEAIKYTTPIKFTVKNNDFFIEKPK